MLAIVVSPTLPNSVLKIISHILNVMKTITTEIMSASDSWVPCSPGHTGSVGCGPQGGGQRAPVRLVTSPKHGLPSTSWASHSPASGKKDSNQKTRRHQAALGGM